MTRFTFIAALFLSLAACQGCGDSSLNSDGSAEVVDAGTDGGEQD